MGKELENIKRVIDYAIAKGLFTSGEAVGAVMDSYRYVAHAVEVFERVGDTAPMKNNHAGNGHINPLPVNNSERIMPEKSISDSAGDGQPKL